MAVRDVTASTLGDMPHLELIERLQRAIRQVLLEIDDNTMRKKAQSIVFETTGQRIYELSDTAYAFPYTHDGAKPPSVREYIAANDSHKPTKKHEKLAFLDKLKRYTHTLWDYDSEHDYYTTTVRFFRLFTVDLTLWQSQNKWTCEITTTEGGQHIFVSPDLEHTLKIAGALR